MFRLLVVVLSLLMGSVAYADKIFDYPTTDMDMLTKRINAPEISTGEFTQVKLLSEMDVSIKSTGIFSLDKDSGMIWINKTPIESITVITGDTICYKANNQVESISTKKNKTVEEVLKITRSIFAQDYKDLVEYFDFYFINSDTQYTLALKAKSKNIATVAESIVVIGDKDLQSIKFNSADGDITTITFDNMSNEAMMISCE